jgi:metal-sulfur cluster biosynthetic enzyme
MSSLREAVSAALEDVVDPCSISAGAPLSIIDMGMVLDLAVDASGAVSICIRPTSAMCTMIAGIMKGVEERVASVDGVTSVHVALKSDSVWTEADLSANGRRILEARRSRSRSEVQVKPHEWKTRRARLQVSSS